MTKDFLLEKQATVLVFWVVLYVHDFYTDSTGFLRAGVGAGVSGLFEEKKKNKTSSTLGFTVHMQRVDEWMSPNP